MALFINIANTRAQSLLAPLGIRGTTFLQFLSKADLSGKLCVKGPLSKWAGVGLVVWVVGPGHVLAWRSGRRHWMQNHLGKALACAMVKFLTHDTWKSRSQWSHFTWVLVLMSGRLHTTQRSAPLCGCDAAVCRTALWEFVWTGWV